MKVTVKFSYMENIIPKGCRNPRDVFFNDGVLVVNIKEISAEEAPIAIKSKGRFLRTEVKEDDQFQIDYRWYKGKLWTNVRVCNATPNSYTANRNDYAHPALESEIDIVDGRYHPHINLWSSGRGISKTIRSNEIKSILKNIILIDGVTYKAASEPRYVINTFGLGNNHGGTAVFATSHFNGNIGKGWYFNLNQREEALAKATKVAERRGDNKSLPMTVNGSNEFEILIPEAIKLKPNKLTEA